ncbi:uncharacterized protein LOC131147772 [Malania oleifera]|uniref:uncharacterized protein LOC131147772 n=1 Tax=Malania oleifera TaxID=397392 RepID=UPI0025ADD2A6|nr:uncharacterized protein LOC131147772 [Malania oleifera]
MDYSWRTELPHNPSNPLPPRDPHSQIFSSHFSYFSHQPQNPNPNPNLTFPLAAPPATHEGYQAAGFDSGLAPPGTHSSVSSYLDGHGDYQAQPGVAYGRQTADTAYYHDPNVQNWPYGTNPIAYATGTTVPSNGTAYSNTRLWMKPTGRPHGNGSSRKGTKKTKVTKIVQSAWCEVCNVDCNTKEVLEQHKVGKKHKKSLEKLNSKRAPAPNASGGSENPTIGSQEKPDKSKSVAAHKSRKAEQAEDLEIKRRKMVASGAAVDAVKVCALCNVVCNSETVFKYHLAGQKHAAMAKKQQNQVLCLTRWDRLYESFFANLYNHVPSIRKQAVIYWDLKVLH